MGEQHALSSTTVDVLQVAQALRKQIRGMKCIQESVGENCTMKWKLGEELQKCLRDFLKAAGIGKGVVPTCVRAN